MDTRIDNVLRLKCWPLGYGGVGWCCRRTRCPISHLPEDSVSALCAMGPPMWPWHCGLMARPVSGVSGVSLPLLPLPGPLAPSMEGASGRHDLSRAMRRSRTNLQPSYLGTQRGQRQLGILGRPAESGRRCRPLLGQSRATDGWAVWVSGN